MKLLNNPSCVSRMEKARDLKTQTKLKKSYHNIIFVLFALYSDFKFYVMICRLVKLMEKFRDHTWQAMNN